MESSSSSGSCAYLLVELNHARVFMYGLESPSPPRRSNIKFACVESSNLPACYSFCLCCHVCPGYDIVAVPVTSVTLFPSATLFHLSTFPSATLHSRNRHTATSSSVELLAFKGSPPWTLTRSPPHVVAMLAAMKLSNKILYGDNPEERPVEHCVSKVIEWQFSDRTAPEPVVRCPICYNEISVKGISPVNPVGAPSGPATTAAGDTVTNADDGPNGLALICSHILCAVCAANMCGVCRRMSMHNTCGHLAATVIPRWGETYFLPGKVERYPQGGLEETPEGCLDCGPEGCNLGPNLRACLLA
ncbi:hypothetical protein B0T18DRAFT_483709 [Schizothecium vesticola]|uniref:RING-type domain-containing protein n=1 Tax=Schizothecium vesticola TaxID=314040 RepID=A0AA40F8P8_9PEZI|nr:hypothetical protein B0T18DRAFT_483709 [Schizothecium vesticola]